MKVISVHLTRIGKSVSSYQGRLSAKQTLCGKMYRDKTATAPRIDSDAGAVEIKSVRYAIGHYGDSVARSRILGLPIGVTQTNLLIVYSSRFD